MLTVEQRELLIAHLDGPVPFNVRNPKLSTLRAALRRGWLRTDREVAPRETRLTDDGRQKLAQALADWADSITRAKAAAARRRKAGMRARTRRCVAYPVLYALLQP